jgi:DNA repair protein RadD
MFELRDYQERAIGSIYDYFENNTGNPLIVMPTASGKSIVIGDFIRGVLNDYPGQRILMLTHVKELIEQNYDKLKAMWKEAPCGIYSAALKRRETQDAITFAGIQSVYRRAEDLGHYDLILVDESHLIPTSGMGRYRSFLNAARIINPAVKVIGFTATPYRLRSGLLTEGEDRIFTDVAIDLSSGEEMLNMIEQGYLAPLVSKSMNTAFNIESVHLRGGEFIPSELQEIMGDAGNTHAALAEVVTYGKDRNSWLIFCSGVRHVENVTRLLQTEYNIRAEFITGQTPVKERERIIDDYKSGRIQALSNCDVLTTGFDAPETDMLVFLRPTQSTGLFVQMCGRGMRPAEGKENCLVLDFARNVERHGPINDVRPQAGGRRRGRVNTSPVKTCPDCRSIVPISFPSCPDCQHQFSNRTLDLDHTASDLELIRRNLDPRQFLQDLNVRRVNFFKHRKQFVAGATPTLRVEYQCGLSTFSEWVCFDHNGYPRRKAEQWWRRHVSSDYIAHTVPKSVEEALARIGELQPPHTVTINFKDKYPKVVDYDREPESVSVQA